MLCKIFIFLLEACFDLEHPTEQVDVINFGETKFSHQIYKIVKNQANAPFFNAKTFHHLFAFSDNFVGKNFLRLGTRRWARGPALETVK